MTTYNFFRLSFESGNYPETKVKEITSLCQFLWQQFQLDRLCGKTNIDFWGTQDPDSTVFAKILKKIQGILTNATGSTIGPNIANTIKDLSGIHDPIYRQKCLKKLNQLLKMLKENNITAAQKWVSAWLCDYPIWTTFHCYIDAETIPDVATLLVLLKFAYAVDKALNEAKFAPRMHAEDDPEYLRITSFFTFPKKLIEAPLSKDVFELMTFFAEHHMRYQKLWSNEQLDVKARVSMILKIKRSDSYPNTLWEHISDEIEPIIEGLKSNQSLTQMLIELNQLFLHRDTQAKAILAPLLFILSQPEVQQHMVLKSSKTIASDLTLEELPRP